jgi:hypothetical protein
VAIELNQSAAFACVESDRLDVELWQRHVREYYPALAQDFFPLDPQVVRLVTQSHSVI